MFQEILDIVKVNNISSINIIVYVIVHASSKSFKLSPFIFDI